MDLNELAVAVAQREGLHEQVSIAQIKEVIRILCNMYPSITFRVVAKAVPGSNALDGVQEIGPTSLEKIFRHTPVPEFLPAFKAIPPPEMVPERGEPGYEEKKTVNFEVTSAPKKKKTKKAKGKKK